MSDAQTLNYRPSAGADVSADSDPVWNGLRLSVWLKIAVVAGLFCAVFWPNLRRLWEKTNPFYGEANWGHSICVPLIGLYYLYVNRDELRSARVKTCWWGLLVMEIGLVVFGYGIWPGQNDFVKDLGMVVTLFGVVLLLAGWWVMRVAWFPIAFLVCALPWPGLVYSWVAGPLQQLAAVVAVNTLQLTGVKAFAGGTKIFIYGQNNALRTLNVAEACAGLRSLMTFISVAAAAAFLSARPLWQKVIVVSSAVPIAIFCNVTRVAGQGLLDHYVSQQLSENFAHQFVGLIMLIPAFLLILLVGWVLDQIFVEEVAERDMASKVVRRTRVQAVPAAGAVSSRGTAARWGEANKTSGESRAANDLRTPALQKAPAIGKTNAAEKPGAAAKAPAPVKPAVPKVAPLRPAPSLAAASSTAKAPSSVVAPPPPSTRLAPRTFTPRGVPPKATPPDTAV